MRFNPRDGSDADCGVLARAWAHRLSYFFNAEILDHALVGAAFSAAAVDAYEEPTELVELARRAPPKLGRRIDILRSIFRAET